MSRMTGLARRTQPDDDEFLAVSHLGEIPHLETRLTLICGQCGAKGRYHVGTVVFDSHKFDSADVDSTERAIGFTGYFRCRKCDAGGPWKFTKSTRMHLAILCIAGMEGVENLPLTIGASATFDRHTFRYATEGEAHLKSLIETEPLRAFLWVRLGNLYYHAHEYNRAEPVYRHAIELDPTDIEAHSMLGELLADTNRAMEAVPNWQAVLRHARNAKTVRKNLRRSIVREAVLGMLNAGVESNGKIKFTPPTASEEMESRLSNEPAVFYLREYDLGKEEDIDDLCDAFLGEPRRPRRPLNSRAEDMMPLTYDRFGTPFRQAEPHMPRNAPCPCGSGHKYKKCCGR